VSAKVESELNGMPAEEAAEWLEMLGVEKSEGGGLGALIRASYKTLGLQTYFTTGGFVCAVHVFAPAAVGAGVRMCAWGNGAARNRSAAAVAAWRARKSGAHAAAHQQAKRRRAHGRSAAA
jgi:ribosome-binding ATPase YchF (GTP1/OBG family)